MNTTWFLMDVNMPEMGGLEATKTDQGKAG